MIEWAMTHWVLTFILLLAVIEAIKEIGVAHGRRRL